jgi:hypothetical protein
VCLHALQRAMVVNGQIVARPMMYVALTYDHRLIDGREVSRGGSPGIYKMTQNEMLPQADLSG